MSIVMASVSALQPPRRKKNVYGKAGRSGYGSSNLNSFFDDDELSVASPTVARQSTVKATYPVRKEEVKTHSLKPVKSRPKRQDAFDVPSSDDEVSSPPKYVSPPKFKPNLYDDTKTSGAQLASWGKSKTATSSKQEQDTSSTRTRTPESDANHQSKAHSARTKPFAESSPRNLRGSTNSQSQTSATASPNSKATVGSTSAAARLAARKRLNDNSAPSSADELSKATRTISKRAVVGDDEVEGTPRKRVRTATALRDVGEVVAMTDISPEPTCDLATAANDAMDVYDFPASSADELSKSAPAIKSPKVAKKNVKRCKLTTYTSRSTPRKGISAPARLAEMIADDTDSSEQSTRSPSASVSRKTTPQQPSTPPSARIRSPETAVKPSGTLTPRQAQLWDRLLPGDPVVPSPSALAMRDLTLSAKRRAPAASVGRTLSKSQSDVPKQRTRLVDRLKASAVSSEDESSGSDEEVPDDTEMQEDVIPVSEESSGSGPAKKTQTVSARTSQSQSQSQSQATSAGGPKITYSRIRSYLPEDSMEDDLMLGFSPETHLDSVPAGRPGHKSAPMSQKSAFDMEDDDDEDIGTGRIRTIHELRASGSSTRGMWDIEEALEDIRHHDVSHRSRRRTALVDLATKLADKTFAARFTGQSCELRLTAECGACPDEIADFILAAAFATMMASDPPEHAVRSLHEHGVVSWLTQLFDRNIAIGKLAKDRRSNMAKASQYSLFEFTETLRKNNVLWAENHAQTMTPRLVALKALDQLVTRLRHLGNTTEVLSSEELARVLRRPTQAVEQDDAIDVSLSISVLESLAIVGLSLDWPVSVLEGVREVLPRLSNSSPLNRHTKFLSLRLCLNLTNGNKRNCMLLAPANNGSTVHCLLDTIKHAFETLETEKDDEKRLVVLDSLILAEGIMINLTEHSLDACENAAKDLLILGALVEIFQRGQKMMIEAESVEESIMNVPLGWLAVMLASLCQCQPAKLFIASKLPAQKLGLLVEAVTEFVRHYEKVDKMSFEGKEGEEIVSALMERLNAVLARLRTAELSIR